LFVFLINNNQIATTAHGGDSTMSASEIDSRVASVWPSMMSIDVLQQLAGQHRVRMTFGSGGYDISVCEPEVEVDPRVAAEWVSANIGLAPRLPRRRGLSRSGGAVRMRYQNGVWEFLDRHGDATRVEYDDPYGPGRFGAVPASEAEIASLPRATSGEVREKDCAVCLEGLEEGEELRKMTCPSSHGFHEGCILKWLRASRLCPLCRFALPAEHEQ
jgi:hypothetical protein